jgi:hypothetical protein
METSFGDSISSLSGFQSVSQDFSPLNISFISFTPFKLSGRILFKFTLAFVRLLLFAERINPHGSFYQNNQKTEFFYCLPFPVGI